MPEAWHVAAAGVGGVALLGVVFLLCAAIGRIAEWMRRGR